MWITNRVVVPGLSGDSRFPNKPRAEDAADAWEADGATFLGVADGVGSRSRAADAASYALGLAKVRSTMERFSSRDDCRTHATRIRDIFQDVQATFQQNISSRRDRLEWKTTLSIVAILKRDFVVYASMGDSILAVCLDVAPGADPQRPQLVLFPRRASRASTDTFTLHNDIGCARIGVVAPIGLNGVILSTDGLEPLLHGTAHKDVLEFDSMMSGLVELLGRGQVRQSEASLWRDDVRSQKGDDIGVSMAAWR